MRIIAGKWRSRRLLRPSETTTRPMPDRVRESIFDILGSHYGTPGALPAVSIADVFAGSGSMGIEALSRGAASCCFVERDRNVLTVLRKNLDLLQIGPEAKIISSDAWRTSMTTQEGSPVDLIFLDPPYRSAEDDSEEGNVRKWFARMTGQEPAPPSLVVFHHFAKVDYEKRVPPGWRLADHRTYGTSAITILAHDTDQT